MKRRRHDPVPVVAAVVLGVVAIGSAISLAPDPMGKSAALSPPAATMAGGGEGGDGVRALFDQGVAYLKDGRAHEATVVFMAAQRLDPGSPEIAVNLGFSYLAQGKAEAAVSQFDTALGIKRDQVNAYYGLAQALEELGQLEGALGAMRTFKHLAPQDSPFHVKAEAAIWEIEDQIRRKRDGVSSALPPGGVTLDGVPVRSFDDIRKDAPAKPEEPK